MRVLIPIDQDSGRESIVNSKFGSSPLFKIVDTEDESKDITINNQSKKFGGIQPPIMFILDQEPDLIFTSHACENALNHIQKAGITPYLVDNLPIINLLAKYNSQELEIMAEPAH